MPDTERGSMRVPGTDGRADKRFALLGRYSSEIRTGCANERPSGSVRGAPGNWCPYRDQQLRFAGQRFDNSPNALHYSSHPLEIHFVGFVDWLLIVPIPEWALVA